MDKVTIIGAGVVGMCTALTLQKRGLAVRLIDERDPGTGTSFGNAGLISEGSCVPISMPGMIKNVPRWLLDPEGPLSVKPGYLPQALPWLMQWVKAGATVNRALQQGRALRQLHKDVLAGYKDLLGDQFDSAIKVTGQLHLWESLQPGRADILAERIRQENGIRTTHLTGDAVFDLVPQLSRAVKRAELYENNGHTTSPYQLVQRLLKIFTDNGGEFIRQRVVSLAKHTQGEGYRLITASDDLSVKQLVLCSGAWSVQLLKGLNIRVPMDTERGYHVSFEPDALDLNIPVLHKERAFGVTAMQDNIRVAGLVEIAGLQAPANMQREKLLVSNVKHLFPNIDLNLKKNFWLGFRPSTPDSLPILSQLPSMPNLFLGFGHGHTGLTGAPTSAQILANMVMGVPETLDITPYDITRF